MSKRVLGLLLTALGLSGCQLIQDQLDGNQAPVVSHFMPDPSQGEAPLLVGFGWEVSDIEDDKLSCTLAYDDGEEQRVENCGEVTNTFHTFQKPGGYTVVLNIVDGMNSVASSITVRVLEAEVQETHD